MLIELVLNCWLWLAERSLLLVTIAILLVSPISADLRVSPTVVISHSSRHVPFRHLCILNSCLIELSKLVLKWIAMSAGVEILPTFGAVLYRCLVFVILSWLSRCVTNDICESNHLCGCLLVFVSHAHVTELEMLAWVPHLGHFHVHSDWL